MRELAPDTPARAGPGVASEPDPGAGRASVAPTVSVCVPVYNGGAFIAETLRSILAQTYTEFELLVTDNRSTDGTVEIVRSFTDPRIRLVINDTNLGAVGNFNHALAQARGGRVKIVCADDVLAPTCLAEQMAALDAAPGAVLACSARRIVDHRGRAWMVRRFPGRSGRVPGREAIARAIRTGTNAFGEPVAVLFDRDAAIRAGGFDANWQFCVDIDFWCRLLTQGDAVIQSAVLCSFRVSRGSWSAALGAAQADEFERFVTAPDRRFPGVEDPRDVARVIRRARRLAKLRSLFYHLLFRGRAGN
jgi:glycosyltransferase involved in cell wall biosynthesis